MLCYGSVTALFLLCYRFVAALSVLCKEFDSAFTALVISCTLLVGHKLNKLTNRMWFSVVCTLIDNGKLANQIARLEAIVVKSLFFSILGGLFASAIIGGNTFYQSRLYQFLTPAVGLNPQWKLCYRASTDGWASSTFHSRCDGKRDTVTIIENGQYVFGGYTDIPWGQNKFALLNNLILYF